jgi:carbon starvation protein
MRALPLLVGALCVLAIAYRYYSAFLASKVLLLDDGRPTPAHRLADGHNFVPTNKWVVFGHHFAAITGAGPLVGPTLAAQFGWLPGYLWILIGVVLAGAVHDFVVLVGSIRHDGQSLAAIARAQLGRRAGLIATVAILFIMVLAIAAMAKVVVTALAESAWGTFTIGATIPIALVMGLYMHRVRPGKIGEATAFGVVALFAAVIGGKAIAASPLGAAFLLSEHKLTIAIVAYGFFASVLPVWLLLAPRDYLSSYMKIGTISLLIIGVVIVNPEIHAPKLRFTHGGPVVPGGLWPFVFITIACGAISGFHGLIGSGTTPKLIDRESDARPIGYGAMLMEAVVGLVALIAAASLPEGDYFAINSPPDKFAALGLSMEHLPELSAQIGERLVGRTGGAVSLAVGMSQIFSSLRGLKHLVAYWYHFAIMFEALFILTTVDAGTRVARFLVQESLGRAFPRRPRWGRTDWWPGTLVATGLVCAGWGYLVWSGSIALLWPLLGIANQLLACIALCTITGWLVNQGRARYAWVTLVPLAFVGAATETAGYQIVTRQLWPRIASGKLDLVVQGWLLATVCVVAMVALLLVIVELALVWRRAR